MDWKTRLRNLPLMMSVGIGICLSNAKAVLQGMTQRKFEFRRTPKYSVVEKDRSWKKKLYRTKKYLGGADGIGICGLFSGSGGGGV